MRWLPREHGATVIWLASTLLALLALPGIPSAVGAAVFVLGCLAALLLLARLTSRSSVLLRVERNPFWTPILSGPLTLIVPFGRLVMVGDVPASTVGLWLVFLAYTVTGVVYTGDAVRATLRGTSAGWRPLLLSAGFVGLLALGVTVLAWLPIASEAVLVPLVLHRLLTGPRSRLESLPAAARVRRLGMAQTANMLAAVFILAAALRL